MVNKPVVVSKAFSMQGWNLSAFLKGYFNIFRNNWTTIKEIGKIVVPLVISAIATKNPALVAGITVVGKAVFDILEYFFKTKTA